MVVRPSEKRMLSLASVALFPSESITCEGASSFILQALLVETKIPRASSCNTKNSLSIPLILTFTICGAHFAGWPLREMFLLRESNFVMKSFRSFSSRRASFFRVSEASERALAKPAYR